MYDIKGHSSVGVEAEYLGQVLTENGIRDGYLSPVDFIRITDVQWLPEEKVVQFTCDIFTNIIN